MQTARQCPRSISLHSIETVRIGGLDLAIFTVGELLEAPSS
jgi:hypothetical protein